jgi:glycosyltransferase involved in cell wall biosynthesis
MSATSGETGEGLRVLHVMPWFYPALVYGGPAQSVYDLARATSRAGWKVRVLTTSANGDVSLAVDCKRDGELKDGVQVRYCKRWLGDSMSPALLSRLAAEIKQADVVHLGLTYSFPVIPTLVLSKRYGKPVVWSPRGALQRYPQSRRRVMKAWWEYVCRRVTPEATVLHVTSEEEARESRQRMPLDAVVVPNGIEVPNDVAHRASSGPLRLMYMGRLHPKKGIENLLEACSLLPETLPWTLDIVGAGEAKYEDALRGKIVELRLSERVRMRGLLVGTEKRQIFESCDLAVFPSHTENFGMVVAEALAHGVPVIASKGMPWSRVQEMDCGAWVENDPRTMAEAILRMAAMQLREMGARGREWMRREFSWDEAAERMIAVYESVIGEACGTQREPVARSVGA